MVHTFQTRIVTDFLSKKTWYTC